MKKIESTIIIEAPAEKVYRVITDFNSFPQWNRFTPRITLTNDRFRVGAEFDLDCQMTEKSLLKNEHEMILEIRPEEYSFCMGTSRTRGRPGIRSFRWQICRPRSSNTTEFINYEEFSGPLAPLVYFLYHKKLQRAFEKYCVSLRDKVLSLK